MNYYPGNGFTVGTAILGSLGQAYPEGTVLEYCKLYGTVINVTGRPVGYANTALRNNQDGNTLLVDTWKGVDITASISTSIAVSDKILTTEKLITQTNEFGYFELRVLRGITVVIACTVFGKQIIFDTTGITAKDLSSYF